MKKINYKIYLIIIAFLVSSCYPNLFTKKRSEKVNKSSTGNFIKITAKNLSEDANILSTQNDELILLVYSKLERDYPEILLQEEFMIDSVYDIKKFKLTKKLKQEDELILLLIEIDTERHLEQIEPIVSLNLKAILEAYQQDDEQQIREFLDDDDLLYITKMSYKNFIKNKINIQGIRLFDAYYYSLKVE